MRCAGVRGRRFDPLEPGFLESPYEQYARLRAHDPVHWSELLEGWVVTRYADVRAGFHDSRLSADRITPFEAVGRLLTRWAVFTDPPDHTRLRSLMTAALTPRAVEGLRPRIAAVVEDLLAGLDRTDHPDLVRDFARRARRAGKASWTGSRRPWTVWSGWIPWCSVGSAPCR